MRTLYPEITPFHHDFFSTNDGHKIYYEQCGNPLGTPVLFIHGGPGGGCSAEHRRFFNPEHYHIILFDQRGCGRSQPHGSLSNNTTQALIGDIEQLRTLLNIDKWLLFGGSWGSTLSLAYAQKHTECVLGLILRGIFLCRPRDLEWFYQDGASHVYPDYWQDYIEPIDPKKRDNIMQAYYEVLTGQDEIKRMHAAKAWSVWEGRCSTLAPSPSLVDHFEDPHVALAMARIEAHYFVNNALNSYPMHSLRSYVMLDTLPLNPASLTA
ncbi:MAG: prolyl aminopeptidase [Pseudomonadota bacterium]